MLSANKHVLNTVEIHRSLHQPTMGNGQRGVLQPTFSIGQFYRKRKRKNET